MGKLAHFRQLKAWQETHELVLAVYQVAREYPEKERFGLVAQMGRAAGTERRR